MGLYLPLRRPVMPASLGLMFGNLSSPVYLIGTLSPRDVDIVLLFRSGSLILHAEHAMYESGSQS